MSESGLFFNTMIILCDECRKPIKIEASQLPSGVVCKDCRNEKKEEDSI